MKNWFSKLLADTNEQGRKIFAIALITLGVSVLSSPLYIYLAVQTGSWQIYVMLGMITAFMLASLNSASLARQNRTDPALAWILGGFYAIVPLLASVISGMGLVLAIAQTLGTLLIVGQTLKGSRATRASMGGIATSVLTLLIDQFAPWERASYPLLSSSIPYISGVAILALGIYILRGYRQYSLRTKLIGGFLLVTLIPLAGTFFFYNRNTRQILTNDANRALSSSSAATANELDAFITANLTNVRGAAQSHILEEYLALAPSERANSETETVLYRDLRAIASRDSIYITSVGLIDTRGVDIADTYAPDLNLDKKDRVWFTSPLRNGLPFASPLEFSEATGQYSLYFSAPIRNVDGAIIGILRVRYNAAVVQKIVRESIENSGLQDGSADLFDENHIVLAVTDHPDEYLKTVVPLSADELVKLQAEHRLPEGSAESLSFNELELEQALNNASQQPIFTFEEENEQLAFARLETQPWVVTSSQNRDIFLAPAQQQTRTATLLAILVVALVTAAGYFVAQSLAAPITRLTAVAEQVATGDNNVQAEVESQDEIGVLAGSFNTMTSKLREFIATLEERVADRTRNLELAAEVGRSVSQVRALDVMLKDAVELIRSQFNLYYVQVYLTDASQTNLLLLSGTGKVGEQLVGRGHRLQLNTGSINGRTATEKKPVVIADTASSATFRPNPLLPDTRSEMAIPLIVGEKVVGVLDLQSEKANALTQELLPAFEALAGQLAIAIQNANLLAETEQARAEVEAQARRLVRSNWADYMDAIHKPEETGFVFEQNKISTMTQAEAIDENSLVAPISVTGETLGNLVVEMEGQSSVAQTPELVNTIARQVAQHIESLRLLESAERYRAESEQASRRLTREGWKNYMDANTDENLSYIYDLNEVRPHAGNGQTDESALSVPLKVRDEILGKFAIHGLDVNDSESLGLANAVAERLGAHIESLRQADQTQSALAQSEKLFDATRALTQATDLQDLVAAAVTTLNIPVVDRALLGLLNYAPDGTLEGMNVVANWSNGTGYEATAVGTHYSSAALRVLSIFTSSAPIFFNDMYNDERVDAPSLELVKRLNVRAMVGLPLFLGPRHLGTLILEAPEPHNFTQDDIRLFTALAPQIATLLESRRQFERAQKQAERESMLNTISQKIQSATSVEAVLQIAARELGHALSAPMTIAQLSMKDKS